MCIMFRYWRIVGTGISFGLFGLGALVIGLFFSILIYPMPLGYTRKRRWTRRTISRACWVYVRVMRGMHLLTFSSRDASRLRRSGAMLIIANHPTLLDVVFLISMMPDTNCVVKKALSKNPFTFAAVTMAGYVLNGGEVEGLLAATTRVLQSQQQLIIFPEGTRTRNPDRIEFQRGAANIALRAGCPIQPVIINCAPLTLRKNHPWYDVPDRPPHFSFVVLEAIDPKYAVDTSLSHALQARQLTRTMLQTINENVHVVC